MEKLSEKPVLGAVSYLNTVPLIDQLGDIAAEYQLRLDVPSRLSDGLLSGQLAAALIPTIEVLANPNYSVVSDACIGCRGPVWSVKLLTRVDWPEVKTVALDEGSRTSVALVKILLEKYWKVKPQFISLPLNEDFQRSKADAVLIIGDRAMSDDQTFFRQFDLGEVWNQWTGLPFVFAVWATAHDEQRSFLDRELSLARDRGLAKVESIVDRVHEQYGLTREQCHKYLTYHLNFYLGDGEREAIRRFAELAAEMKIIPQDTMVRFYDCEIVG